MIVKINHKAKEIKDESNLFDLLNLMDLSDKGIALAVNNRVIPKSEWNSFVLKENTNITLIRATQGG